MHKPKGQSLQYGEAARMLSSCRQRETMEDLDLVGEGSTVLPSSYCGQLCFLCRCLHTETSEGICSGGRFLVGIL